MKRLAEKKSTQKKYGIGGAVLFLLACIASFTLHCRFEVAVGGYPDSMLMNGLDKLLVTFTKPQFTDVVVAAAIYVALRYVKRKDQKVHGGFLVLSWVMAFILVAAISFCKFNSAAFLFTNSYQIMLSVFCTAGFATIIYVVCRCVDIQFSSAAVPQEIPRSGFVAKHFLLIGFIVICLGWLPWIIMNYPGSSNPDGVEQLKQFLGDADWSVHHPPLSTLIMGSIFIFGRWIWDANFGFFLYCLMQTITGAWIFSFSMKKLQNLGISVKWCMAGILYFAFTPLWGTYAQWMEKDLLYAEMAVLQVIYMLEILVKKECGKKDAVILGAVSMITVFLRHNGIYAVVPALLFLAIWLKGNARRRIVAALAVVFVVYEGVVRGIFPAIGLGRTSIAESLSIPFQQTARYVCEHTQEVTEEEREAIDASFINYDVMFQYDPLLSDPVKNYFIGQNMGNYFKVWFQMFFKHPGSYVAAFFNMGYSYLAPVSQKIEAWVQVKYYDYMLGIGLRHTMDEKCQYALIRIWNSNMMLPLFQYLASPGFYTWIVIFLAAMLIKRRKWGALILFIPGGVNILVCLASPVAGTVRYALPTIAMVPFLIGWTWYAAHHEV